LKSSKKDGRFGAPLLPPTFFFFANTCAIRAVDTCSRAASFRETLLFPSSSMVRTTGERERGVNKKTLLLYRDENGVLSFLESWGESFFFPFSSYPVSTELKREVWGDSVLSFFFQSRSVERRCGDLHFKFPPFSLFSLLLDRTPSG